MQIGIGIWAFLAFIGFVILWNVGVKRKINEAMLLGLLLVTLFGGISNYGKNLAGAMLDSTASTSALSPVLFIAMAGLMETTGIIGRLINILNSMLGRIRGGPAYVSVLGSALMGSVSGSGSANAATVGSITIPWMKKTGWPPEVAATMNAGNAGLGISIPPSTSMFIMLGFADVAAYLSTGDVYFTILTAGLWTLLYRLILVWFYSRRYSIPEVDIKNIMPFREAIKKYKSSLILFLGIMIPLFLIVGPISDALAATTFGKAGIQSIEIIVWVPVMIILFVLVEGRKHLPKNLEEWRKLAEKLTKSYYSVAPTVLFSMASSEVLKDIGFGNNVTVLLQQMGMSKLPMLCMIAVIVGLAAGPLSATATTTALGTISFLAMVEVGVHPAVALAVFLVFSSTEGASPPSSSAIYISGGIAECPVEKMFKPLILHYCIPIPIVGILIAMGLLPVIL